MFPKNKISLLYRLLCLVCYVGVILVVNNIRTLVVLYVAFIVFALNERSFRNIELIIITGLTIWISTLIDSNIFFKILLLIDYALYFLDASYYNIEEEATISENDYIRFKNNKKKGSNNILALYLTIHLIILFVAIMVG